MNNYFNDWFGRPVAVISIALIPAFDFLHKCEIVDRLKVDTRKEMEVKEGVRCDYRSIAFDWKNAFTPDTCTTAGLTSSTWPS